MGKISRAFSVETEGCFGEEEVSVEARRIFLRLKPTHVDDDLGSGSPVGGGGDLVGVAELERVDDTEDLIELTSGGGLQQYSRVSKRFFIFLWSSDSRKLTG